MSHNGLLIPGKLASTGGVYVHPFLAEDLFAYYLAVASFIVQGILLQLREPLHTKNGPSLLECRSNGVHDCTYVPYLEEVRN
jgi:hypothetical protein